MKKTLLILTLLFSVNLRAGIPVYDAPRHVTDILDNIQDILDQINQIKNQIEQIEKLTEQVKQMDDYLERVGKAAGVKLINEHLGVNDVEDILDEIEEYTFGEGLTEEEKKENTELFGDIDKEEHIKVNEPLPEKKYSIFERVEKEYAAYKKSSRSINRKRLAILRQLENLGIRLNSASTDQEVQKINSSINAHKLMLTAVKDEEERQYRSFTAELKRNENSIEKEIRRFEERAKKLDLINRTKPQVYKLTQSAKILNLIQGGK